MENDAYVSAYSLFYLPVLLFNSCISATLIPLFFPRFAIALRPLFDKEKKEK